MIDKNRKTIIPLKGERNGMSKLKEKDVESIRQMHLDGNNCTKLSGIYGVSISAIDRIVRKKSWSHIKGEVNV